THKVAYLISLGVSANSILAVTFTNKAGNEMKERIMKLLVHGSRFIEKQTENQKPIAANQFPFVGTFHAFCAKLLRIEGKYIGLPSGYLIYDSDDSLTLVKKIMKAAGIDTKHFRPSSILGAISSAKGELLDPEDYRQFARGYFGETATKVYVDYQQELSKIGACDFDDLLFKTVKLFEKNRNILEKYSSRFKYVLVDEYQDVNTAQYVLTLFF
ncbi:MAG: UvrD/REP helicase, partial [Candidatus Curtissbacteria bacterium GW2011_GWA1_40_16]